MKQALPIKKGFEKYLTFPDSFDAEKEKAKLEEWLNKMRTKKRMRKSPSLYL